MMERMHTVSRLDEIDVHRKISARIAVWILKDRDFLNSMDHSG